MPASAPPPEPSPRSAAAVPIVGIGASAASLESIEGFLRNTRDDGGLAYVIVLRREPDRDAPLAARLQRATAMPVAEVADGIAVERDHVYVSPPGCELAVRRGVLHLVTPPETRGHVIDVFFRALAEDQQDASIGVVLSGAGADGTLGLRAIKEQAGATFVQAPASARLDGMPRSAIDAGVADVVAPVEELPGRILAYRGHLPRIAQAEAFGDLHAQRMLAQIFALLRARTGNDFSLYKTSTLVRRIERRMGLHAIDELAGYVRFLRENPRDLELLVKELLIGVTRFFRDAPAWETLTAEVLPHLIASQPAGATLRAWVAGCSTGEEAYSLAIAFAEALDAVRPARDVALKIFATDLDRDAIDQARKGLFPDRIAADVPPERLRRFFVHEERGYRASTRIREMIVFAPQNVCTDPPFTRLDLLCCRNLMIYFSAELQRQLVPLFHHALKPGGILFLGSAETVGPTRTMFAPLAPNAHFYRKLEHGEAAALWPVASLVKQATRAAAAELALDANGGADPARNLQALADRVLIQHHAPLGILCTASGDILYLSGHAGTYLEPAVGKANLNVFAMARDELRHVLSNAFGSALRVDRPATARGVRIRTEGGTQTFDLTVQRLTEPDELRGHVMIVIADVEGRAPAASSRGTPARDAQVAELEQALRRARDELQTAREQTETSLDELTSANEGLQAMNEALTTANQELQAVNQELQAVNEDLRANADELARSNHDLKSLLDGRQARRSSS